MCAEDVVYERNEERLRKIQKQKYLLEVQKLTFIIIIKQGDAFIFRRHISSVLTINKMFHNYNHRVFVTIIIKAIIRFLAHHFGFWFCFV